MYFEDAKGDIEKIREKIKSNLYFAPVVKVELSSGNKREGTCAVVYILGTNGALPLSVLGVSL